MFGLFKFSGILVFILLISQGVMAGRYYNAAIGRFLQVDPLADKYPSWSSYTYSINNPIRFIDPDGKDVLDKITGQPLSVAEMNKRTLNEMNRILVASEETKTGMVESELNLETTQENVRKDLYQPSAGGEVWWGGDLNVKNFLFFGTYSEGIPRFKVDTWAQLTPADRGAGITTYGTAGVSSHHLGKNKLVASFNLTKIDKKGNLVKSNTLIKLIGTLEEINSVLSQKGWEVYKNDWGSYDFRRIQSEDEENEEDQND